MNESKPSQVKFRLPVLQTIKRNTGEGVSANTAATETYYMMGLLKFRIKEP